MVAAIDGMRFVVPVPSLMAKPNRKYFGPKCGMTFLNMINDQAFGTGHKIVAGTDRDCLHAIDLFSAPARRTCPRCSSPTPDLMPTYIRDREPAGPVVALNRAVAITERDGPEHGLAALEAIVGMERSHLWHAALADNFRRLGRAAEAAGELETAAALAPTEGERRLLLSRLLDVRPEPA